MISIIKKIKNKRQKEINNRLKNLTIKQIKDYFLCYGFYPESQYLPSDFFTSTDLSKRNSIDMVKLEKDFYINPSSILFPKTQFSFRKISVPPVKYYLQCIEFITNKVNWSKILKHLILGNSSNIIPYSIPLFYENDKRSEIGICNYKVMTETDLPRIIEYYDYVIKVDIKEFYPSIYTHSISWSLDQRTNYNYKCPNLCCKSCNHAMCKCDHKCKNYWANKLDFFTRNLNLQRTKGILIGPYVSDLVSEILLKKIDIDITKELKSIGLSEKKYIGLRFKDDFIFFTNNKSDAEKILKEVNKVLFDYHLSVNDNKTSISSSIDFQDDKVWKTDIEYLKKKIDESFAKKGDEEEIYEKDIRLIVKKAKEIFKEYNDEYILKTILGTFVRENTKVVNILSNVEESRPYIKNLNEIYETSFSLIGSLCKLTPSSWPSYFAFIDLCYTKKTKVIIQGTINNMLDYFIKRDESIGILWCFYIAWRKDLNFDKKKIIKIKERYKDNWLIMSFIDSKNGKYELQDGTVVSLINTDTNKAQNISEIVSVFGYQKK